MFNNELYSDVKFVVREANGELGSKQVIPAHKLMLSISSPVFEAMFHGALAETGDTIVLPDCEYDSLLELFRYMYSDEVNLSGSNVMGVLYLAKKYMVPSLADKCAKYLKDNLGASNVFGILPQAQKYEEKSLVDQCWKVIEEQTGEAVKSDGFSTIELSLLEAVVERDTLNIQEIELFKAGNLWATKRCEEQGVATDGSEKRRILGERIVKGIRFPIMKEHEFADVVLDCKILTPDEAFRVVKFFNSVLSSPVGFPEEDRTGLRELFQRCCRFRSVKYGDSGYPYLPGKKDCLFVSVSRDVRLHGLAFCGSKNAKYSVTLRIKNFKKSEYVFSETGTFSSKLIKTEPVSYYGFCIFLEPAVIIRKGFSYRLEASISGANSWFVQDGRESVLCPGVTFSFENSSASTNGTIVRHGQFPELLFTLT